MHMTQSCSCLEWWVGETIERTDVQLKPLVSRNQRKPSSNVRVASLDVATHSEKT